MTIILCIAYATGFILLVALVMRRAMRHSILMASVAAVLLGVLFFYLVFPGLRVGSVTIPGIAMLAGDSELPLPVPGFAFWTYLVLTVIGVLLVVSATEESLAAFIGPIRRLLVGETSGPGKTLRGPLLFGLLPLTVGGLVFSGMMPATSPPVAGRQAHPSIPYDESFTNPLRQPTAEMLTAYDGSREKFHAAMVHEGRHLYAKLCAQCHGGKADGTGLAARALRLPPADFTDPGTIATLVEGYAFKRIQDGGIGLPAAGTPWDSAMPRWKDDLTDEQIHKILLAEYDLAGVSPRVPEKLE